MTSVQIPESVVPSSVAGETCELAIVEYPIHFGEFGWRTFRTNNELVKKCIDDYCTLRDFTSGWEKCNGTYEMTKVPFQLLLTILSVQTDVVASKMIGAWPIAMNLDSNRTALNVLVGRRTKSDGTPHIIDKFSLYYQSSYEKTESITVPLTTGVSFRTGVLGSDLIDARVFLLTELPEIAERSNLKVDADVYEDVIFFDCAATAKLFVDYMITNHSDKLRTSYEDSSRKLITDELTLFERHETDTTDTADTTLTFPISIYLTQHSIVCDVYPKEHWSLILSTHQQALRENEGLPLVMTCLPLDRLPRRSSGVWTPLPHFYDANVGFGVVDVDGTPRICGAQRTDNGGLRYVFLVTIERGAKTFLSPFDNSPQPAPTLQEQRVKWYWSDAVLKQDSLLQQFRDTKADSWTMYTDFQSDRIETHYQSGATDCNITVGIVEVTIHFGTGNRTLAVQIHNQRKHLIRRYVVDEHEYQKDIQRRKSALSDLLQSSLGEQTECVICSDELHTSKCVKLPCAHVFHALCIQHCLMVTSPPMCPCCRQVTNVSSEVPGSQAMYSGR